MTVRSSKRCNSNNIKPPTEKAAESTVTQTKVYPIVCLDGIVFKVRKDAQVINKCLYLVLGINMDGRKEILGLWMSENESASFWATVCNELHNRGVQDILISRYDNLSGFFYGNRDSFPRNRAAALRHTSNPQFYQVCALLCVQFDFAMNLRKL